MEEDAKKRQEILNNKYKKENYDRITMLVPKGTKQKLNEYAGKLGVSASMFLNIAMQEKMERMDEMEKGQETK